MSTRMRFPHLFSSGASPLGRAIPLLALAGVLTVLAAASQAGSGPTPCASGPSPTGLISMTLPVDGLERRAALYIPEGYSGAEPVPLILDLHASGIAPEVELEITGMAAAAESQGFLVALPEGVTPFERGGVTWNVPHDPDGPDDVAFVAVLLDRLVRTHCIDPDRIYATGFSGGARFASELACRLPERIAAISAVGGLRHPTGSEGTCLRSPKPVSVLALHSADDPINVFDGDPERSPPYWTYGVEEALGRWRAHLGCEGAGRQEALSNAVMRTSYADCRNGGEVVLYALSGSGHTWPGSRFDFPDFVGATERDLDATALAIDWFERHGGRSE